MFRKNDPTNGAATSVDTNALEVCNIATGTTIQGSFNAQSNIRLEGTIEGDVQCKGRIVLSKNARITGDVQCYTMICEGHIEGNVTAQDSVHLLGTASLKGNLIYRSLQIDQGAVFNGQAKTSRTPKEAPVQQ